MRREHHSDDRRTKRVVWIPKTELGKKVANKEITDLDQIYASGKKVLEPQIVEFLLPNLKENVLSISSTQRMTACGRKQQMKAVVLVGNFNGYVGIGVGKAAEVKQAINEGILDAKKNLIKVNFGCGSWECSCGTQHSIDQEFVGRNSSTQITLKPAPRGVGVVAGDVARQVLQFAGVKDVWTFTKGRTRNKLNMAMAVVNALNASNNLKKGKMQYPVEIPEEKVAEQKIVEEAKTETSEEEKPAQAA